MLANVKRSAATAAAARLHAEEQEEDRIQALHLNTARSAWATVFNYRSMEALEEKERSEQTGSEAVVIREPNEVS